MHWRLSESQRAYVEATLRETAGLQARIAELEAAARDLAEAWERRAETDDKDKRIAALEAAARATCDVVQRYGWCEACSKATRPRPGYLGEPHRSDCPVGALEALLEEA